MWYGKHLALATILAGSVLLGGQPEQAAAQQACCRITPGGTAIAAESFKCNTNSAETRRLAPGQYEVDFTPLNTDVRRFVRLCTIDSQTNANSEALGITCVDRFGDNSSIFVRIQDQNGNVTNEGFNACLF
jgi:hypothetical protein